MSIKQFQTICFALISAATVLVSCSTHLNLSGNLTMCKPLSVIAYRDGKVTRLKSEINFNQAQLSGITIVKQKGDTVVGAFINEFGIKGFEFEACKGKCKITNLMSKLNKWYIRQTIENDLAFIFTITNQTFRSEEMQIASYSKTQFRYTLTQTEKIRKVERMEKGKLTGKLHFENDTTFIMSNIKRNLIYKMQILSGNQ